jgi:3,4-dihydroxy 2-butanone 4-phosphate synthase/GTP cyclohydrolase II
MSDAIQRVEEAIKAISNGEMVILLDDEERENEGDFCMAAEKVTPERINFMTKQGRGLICLTLPGDRLDELEIPMMVDRQQNDSQFETAFTVSIEAREGVSTGISASDRAQTIEVAVDDDTSPEDLVTPGHVFPLRARDGGVLVRTGQTEGSVDLARLAGLKPAGVICEIMNEDGTMARRPDLEEISEEFDIPMLSVADIIKYRLRRESLVEVVRKETLPTMYPGDWDVRVYRSLSDDVEHLAFVCGTPREDEPTPVRILHRCETFDVFLGPGSKCVNQVSRVMQHFGERGCGVVVYLDEPRRTATELLTEFEIGDKDPHAEKQTGEEEVNQPKEHLTVIGIGSQILMNLGVGEMELYTNQPKEISGLDAYGLEVTEQNPIPGE